MIISNHSISLQQCQFYTKNVVMMIQNHMHNVHEALDMFAAQNKNVIRLTLISNYQMFCIQKKTLRT